MHTHAYACIPIHGYNKHTLFECLFLLHTLLDTCMADPWPTLLLYITLLTRSASTPHIYAVT
jgi:hypothetical protein